MHHSIPENVGRIREAMEEGIPTAEIAKMLNLKPQTVKHYAYYGRLSPRIEAIRKAIEQNVGSIEDLCKIGGNISPPELYQFSAVSGFDIPQNWIPYKTWPEVDALVSSGESAFNIAHKVGATREHIRHYLVGSGQHERWVERRKAIKDEEKNAKYKARANLVAVLNAAIDEAVQEKGWAYHKALEYIRSFKHIKQVRLADKALIIFERYERAVKSGKQVSLEKLSEGLGLYSMGASRILKIVGLGPLYGTCPKTPQYKKDAIRRAYHSGMSANDVAYFLTMKYYVVANTFNQMGKPKRQAIPLGSKGIHLTYRLASQIYEAIDLGFKQDEVQELLDAKPRTIKYALNNRQILEPRIVSALKTLFPDKAIDKPYLLSRP